MDNEPIISIHDLSYRYFDRPVIENISLNVAAGTFMGIMGPNGGGKTTLLRIILGLLPDYEGSVTILGRSARNPCRTGCCLGYVPQKREARERFPVSSRDVVEMGLYARLGLLRGLSPKDRDEIQWIMGRTGCDEYASQMFHQLSGGQQQRVLIARALVSRPRILALDEPLTGVDQKGVLDFINLIIELKKELELTIVMVSHDFRFLNAACDTIACLNRAIHCHVHPAGLTKQVLDDLYQCDFEAYSASKRVGGV